MPWVTAGMNLNKDRTRLPPDTHKIWNARCSKHTEYSLTFTSYEPGPWRRSKPQASMVNFIRYNARLRPWTFRKKKFCFIYSTKPNDALCSMAISELRCNVREQCCDTQVPLNGNVETWKCNRVLKCWNVDQCLPLELGKVRGCYGQLLVWAELIPMIETVKHAYYELITDQRVLRNAERSATARRCTRHLVQRQRLIAWQRQTKSKKEVFAYIEFVVLTEAPLLLAMLMLVGQPKSGLIWYEFDFETLMKRMYRDTGPVTYSK